MVGTRRSLRERRLAHATDLWLFAAAALLAEAHLLGELRARGRVARRDHRIVGRQAPFLAILLGGHVVLRAQMALERLELLAVLETDQVVRRDRFLDRDRRLERFRL